MATILSATPGVLKGLPAQQKLLGIVLVVLMVPAAIAAYHKPTIVSIAFLIAIGLICGMAVFQVYHQARLDLRKKSCMTERHQMLIAQMLFCERGEAGYKKSGKLSRLICQESESVIKALDELISCGRNEPS